MSIAKNALRLASFFEAEVLVNLMLRFWKHPQYEKPGYASVLLDTASEVLLASSKGEKLIEDMKPADVNLIAAIVYAETSTLAGDPSIDRKDRMARQRWIAKVRRALPSCFTNPKEFGY
jgi:hypothetical protein